MAIFLPLLRADVTMLDTYVYTAERPFDCPITAYGGSDDRRVTRAALEAWRTHTRPKLAARNPRRPHLPARDKAGDGVEVEGQADDAPFAHEA